MFGIQTKAQKELQELRQQIAELRNESVAISDVQPGSEMFDLLTAGMSSAAGPVVNEKTAMKVGAMYACVQLIAGAIAGLPLHVYRRTDVGRERVNDHPIWQLLNVQPDPAYAADVFWESISTGNLLHGDSVAAIQRNRRGEASGFLPVADKYLEVRKVNGRLVYGIFLPDFEPFALDQDDVLHFPGLGFDGCRSLSPIRYAAREAIGVSLAAEEFSSRFFSNGARVDIVFKHPNKKLLPEQAEVLRKTFVEKHSGTSNAHSPAVLSGGVEIEKISQNAEESQLLQTRSFQVADIARVYGVPPHMIGSTEKVTAWGSGIEEMSIGFVKFTLKRWLRRYEKEVNRKLFMGKPEFVEFSVEGLLRGDSKSRAEFNQRALGGSSGPGWMTINEVRRLENLPPIDGGDQITQWQQKGAENEAQDPPTDSE